eukprot:CAMPEP_0204314098 /NCGR_PEP_ID=MMETSP0469-20131031/4010_1 /ASSEMBLY_ACC=CAM_ASM_000384 /TAXON_ID=2969 /ORGANISM="Oxyrrhis marina" /LENGTH=374 /DNA_ID=CAMNT_0051294525 /DNA_START=137 /DNA_END=1259 /DNA_ORIENTATION=-
MRSTLQNGFPFPILLSGLGIATTGAVARLLAAIGALQIRPVSPSELPSGVVLLVAACTAGGHGLGNAAFFWLTLPFIQMLKSGTPVIVMVALVVSGVERISGRVAASTVVVALGTLIAAFGETEVVWTGVVVFLSSQVLEATRCVATQHFLQRLRFSPWEAAYYISPPTAACLVVLSAVLEGPRLLDLDSPPPVLPLVTCSVLGLGINLANYLVLKHCSSLAMKLLLSARDIGLLAWGVVALGEGISALQCVGYFVSVVAFLAYSYFRACETRPTVPLSTPPTSAEAKPASCENIDGPGHGCFAGVALFCSSNQVLTKATPCATLARARGVGPEAQSQAGPALMRQVRLAQDAPSQAGPGCAKSGWPRMRQVRL